MKYSTCRVKKLKMHDICTLIPSGLPDGLVSCVTRTLREVKTKAHGQVFYMNSMSISMPHAKCRSGASFQQQIR
jgi:hypothetical protein